MSKSLVVVGRIGAPHGVRGEVKLESFMEDPLAIARCGPLSDESGRRRFVVKLLRAVAEGRYVASVAGVGSREQAAALTNVALCLQRSQLPEAQADEFYWADLVGLQAETTSGTILGDVVAVHDYGGGPFLEIRRPDAAELFMPFTRRVVSRVAIDEGRLILEPPDETEAQP
jgi:16S rRNA processing protein RimM